MGVTFVSDFLDEITGFASAFLGNSFFATGFFTAFFTGFGLTFLATTLGFATFLAFDFTLAGAFFVVFLADFAIMVGPPEQVF
jgi:hypothetical protein